MYSQKLHVPPEHNPKLHMTMKAINLREDLVKDLVEIGKISGEYNITPNADALHKEIYDSNYYKKNTDFRLEPYRGRKGTPYKGSHVIISK